MGAILITSWHLQVFSVGLTLLAAALLGARWWSRRWLPKELRRARLVLSAATLESAGPRRLRATLARVYKLPDGHLVVMSFRTRSADRIYASDVRALSAQAWLLGTHELPVSPIGFVVVRTERWRQRAHRIELHAAHKVEAAYDRTEALLAGTAIARRANNTKCDSCGHQAHCHPGRRGY